MSREESQNMPLRELTRELINKVEQHQSDSAEFREKMSNMFTNINVHNTYLKEKVDEHEKHISELKSAYQIQKGFLAAVSAIGLTFIIDFFRRVFH